MSHVTSASVALQTASENRLQVFRSSAVDLTYTKSSILFKVGIGKSLFIDLALLMSLLNAITVVSLGLPLNPFSDISK